MGAGRDWKPQADGGDEGGGVTTRTWRMGVWGGGRRRGGSGEAGITRIVAHGQVMGKRLATCAPPTRVLVCGTKRVSAVKLTGGGRAPDTMGSQTSEMVFRHQMSTDIRGHLFGHVRWPDRLCLRPCFGARISSLGALRVSCYSAYTSERPERPQGALSTNQIQY